jgi:hypothetical protein
MILAALITPFVGSLTVRPPNRRAANLEESIWASPQLRGLLQSRDEKATDAEPAAAKRRLSLQVRYYLVRIRPKLRLLGLRRYRSYGVSAQTLPRPWS